jgi:hypothetical protein
MKRNLQVADRRSPGRKRNLLVACLFVAACGAGDSLEGSLSATVSLDFTTVAIQVTPNAVAVQYQRPGPTGTDIVLQITANTTGVDLTHGGTINLAEMVGTAQRGSITRVVSGDTRSALPTLQRGSLTFSDGVAAGQGVSGSFDALFATGTGFGAGQTAFGDFSAQVSAPQ